MRQRKTGKTGKIGITRAERRRMNAYTCHFCKDYYKESGTKDMSSRHRGNPRSPTPENFWEMEFPSDEECIKRGYISENIEVYHMKPLEQNVYHRIQMAKEAERANGNSSKDPEF
ncbi:dna endonuclease rbbp8 [Lasius niger]|uniref:Dna endonuclease rbbp8 n=1 Tax=Lasius niger TaxID=67767 RepID=A0A0J7JTD2_LASNI|nr:dna endonuclease rbbp8 [Lasius niger]